VKAANRRTVLYLAILLPLFPVWLFLVSPLGDPWRWLSWAAVVVAALTGSERLQRKYWP
jgi:hypothetical protein